MNQKFLRIPVGDIIEINPTMSIINNPTIRYQQEANPVCAYAALASVLYYFEFKIEAENIM